MMRFFKTAALLTLVVLLQVIGLPSATAGTMTSPRLFIENQSVSTASDHVMKMVTPTGVDDASDTIILEYETGFSLTSITESEVVLGVDDDDACDGPFTPVNSAAVAAAGQWGVAIAGQTVTFTAPTDAAPGEIPADRCIEIAIGGANQIVAPGTAGSYEIDMYGTFDDQTLFSVGIANDTEITVSATVGSPPDSGRPDPDPDPDPEPEPADTTAPVISNIVVSSITETSAIVTWETDEPATTDFVYGLDTSYTTGSVADTTLQTSHTRTLTGLTLGTEYHFLITAEDAEANASSSTDNTFTTLDLTPLIISNLSVSAITETTATVYWETNKAATTMLGGTGLPTYTDLTYATEHIVLLTGLTPGTGYTAEVSSLDAFGNLGNDTVSFTTLIDLPPSAVTNLVAVAGDGQVTLSWTNPTDADFNRVSLVFLAENELGPSVTFPTTRAMGNEIYMGTDETFVHTGLVNGTEYFYTIFAFDNGGNLSSGASASATPSATIIPPVVTPGGSLNIFNEQVTNVAQTTATVTWETDAPADSRAEITTVGSFYDAGLVSVHSLSLTGLSAGTTYTLDITSQDAGGNTATERLSFTTLLEVTPDSEDGLSIFNARAIPTDTTTARILWNTNISADSSVAVPDVGTFSRSDLVTDHEIELTRLEPDTLYVVTLRSQDASGGEATALLSFRTPAESDPAASGVYDVTTRFLAARDTIALTPLDGRLRALGGRSLLVELRLDRDAGAAVSAQLSVGESLYTMTPSSVIVADTEGSPTAIRETAVYTARVITPGGSSVLAIDIIEPSGATQRLAWDLAIVPEGTVSARKGGAVENATVVIESGSSSWDAVSYGQSNPVVTGPSGTFGWYVPNGTYRVRASATGYREKVSSSMTVTDNIFTLPVELMEELVPILEAEGPIVTAALDRAEQVLSIVRDSEAVQSAVSIAAPAIAVTAVSTASALAVGFNAIRFLQYIFSAPFLLYRRRRRKKWGVIYDSLRKVPVDLAIVRLLDAKTKRVVKSIVTDRQGRYLFIADPGVYRIDVRKAGFAYPTQHLKDVKRDGDFLDVYHGEEIVVEEEGATITANIPVDPEGEAKSSRQLSWDVWKRRFMYTVSIAGLIIAVAVAIVEPTAWTITVALIQVLVLLLFVRLAIPVKPKNWGIVYDEKTHRPVTKAVVRIFDPKYNKLLETQITDSKGRYAFLVGPSQFYTTYDKSGYGQVRVEPIDRTDTKESSYVSIDVGLKKHK